MSPFVAEIVGTMILTLFGCGVVANCVLSKSKAEGGGWIVITMGWGFAVAFAVYVSGKYSGGHLNPAVTIGLASIGAFPWADVPAYILAQIIGGFTGSVLVYLAFLPHWKETENADLKLAVFSTSPAIPHNVSNFICEFIGTAILLFILLGIGANKFSDGLNPIIVGFYIMAIGMSLGGPTGYAINPARDLGPRIAHTLLPIAGKGHSGWGYSWIPIVAPITGGVTGSLLYKALVG